MHVVHMHNVWSEFFQHTPGSTRHRTLAEHARSSPELTGNSAEKIHRGSISIVIRQWDVLGMAHSKDAHIMAVLHQQPPCIYSYQFSAAARIEKLACNEYFHAVSDQSVFFILF